MKFKYKPGNDVFIIRLWECQGYSNIWLSPHTNVVKAKINKCKLSAEDGEHYAVSDDDMYYNNIPAKLVFKSQEKALKYLANKIIKHRL